MPPTLSQALDQPLPPLLPALLLNARLTAAEALPRLLASDAQHLAVRRVEGLVVFWYVMRKDWALPRVQQALPHETLKQVLSLHEYGSAPVLGAAGAAQVEVLDRDAVVLDGAQFMGVQTVEALQDVVRLRHEQTLQDLTLALNKAKAQASHEQDLTLRQVQTQTRSLGAQQHDDLPREAPPKTVHTRVPRMGASAPRPAAAAAPAPAPAPEPSAVDAYPRIDAPDTVAPAQAFTVTVGLSCAPQQGVVGDAIHIELPPQVQDIELEVLLMADGFEAPQGWSARLQVSRQAPDAASVQFGLIAPSLPAGDSSCLSSLRVLYSHQGQVCGTATRRMAVVAPDQPVLDQPQGQGQLWTGTGTDGAGSVQLRADLPPVDLTVIVDKPDADPSEGRFLWRFTSIWPVDLPAAPLPWDLGTGSAELGGKIIGEVQGADANGMAELFIGGLGRHVRDAAPPELWPLLGRVKQAMQAQGVDRPLNVLLLTAEAHVPWELALLEDDEKLITEAPPLLGCQVNLGRWPLQHALLPPPAQVTVQHMAAVIGDYAARSGWRKLEQAEAEGQALVARYQAVPLSADAAQIKQLLMARLGSTAHGAEAVHFACHGEALQAHPLDAAIILGNGARLSPLVFGNAPLGKTSSPFLFMNACQVGKAGELLASFSGFAGEAIKGGFRGFLAPLWSVEDQLAHDIALNFYEQAFGAPGQAARPLADILRQMRAKFSDDEAHSLTRLAYVYYGHPGLTLQRQPLETQP